MTDPAGRIPRAVSHVSPQTASDFATYFERSALGERNREDIKTYRAEFVGQTERATNYMLSARAERAKRARPASPYTVSIPQQTAAVMVRSIQMLRGNPAEVIVMVAYVEFVWRLWCLVLTGLCAGRSSSRPLLLVRSLSSSLSRRMRTSAVVPFSSCECNCAGTSRSVADDVG